MYGPPGRMVNLAAYNNAGGSTGHRQHTAGYAAHDWCCHILIHVWERDVAP